MQRLGKCLPAAFQLYRQRWQLHRIGVKSNQGDRFIETLFAVLPVCLGKDVFGRENTVPGRKIHFLGRYAQYFGQVEAQHKRIARFHHTIQFSIGFRLAMQAKNESE